MVLPLVLGQAYRLRYQISILEEKLLKEQISQEVDCEKVISFLCSNFGSHDYTINRREAEFEIEGHQTDGSVIRNYYECLH